jgi:hypothetical protein
MTTEFELLMIPACVIAGWIGYRAARRRREPSSPGALLRYGLRFAVGSVLIALPVIYILQWTRVLGDLIGLLVFPELARAISEELGNSALLERRHAVGNASSSPHPGVEGGPGIA